MQPRKLAILSVVVLALGAYVWFVDRDLPSSEERAELAKKVLPLERLDIRGLILEWGEERVVLDRSPTADEEAETDEETGDLEELDAGDESGPWRIVEPLEARADRGAVDRLLTALLNLEKERTLALAEVDTAEVGLDSPRATVTVVLDGEEEEEPEWVLAIGAQVPASNTMLVKLSDRSEVFVVADGVFADVTKESGDWRSKEVFHGRRYAIQRITLTSGDRRIELARRDEDFWLQSPTSDRADEDAVNGILTELTGLLALSFVDDGENRLAELGLDPPEGVLEVLSNPGGPDGNGQDKTFRLELGTEVPGADLPSYYARTPAQIFETGAKLKEPLARSVEEWRSPALSGMGVYTVSSVKIEDEAGVLELRKDGGDWLRGEEKIPYNTMNDLLHAVDDSRAEGFLKGPELEALTTTPSTTLTYGDDDETQEVLSLYPATAGGVPARAHDRDVALLLSLETVEGIREKIRQVREAEPLESEEAGEEADEDGSTEEPP